jgi:hypothetical protein
VDFNTRKPTATLMQFLSTPLPAAKRNKWGERDKQLLHYTVEQERLRFAN